MSNKYDYEDEEKSKLPYVFGFLLILGGLFFYFGELIVGEGFFVVGLKKQASTEIPYYEINNDFLTKLKETKQKVYEAEQQKEYHEKKKKNPYGYMAPLKIKQISSKDITLDDYSKERLKYIIFGQDSFSGEMIYNSPSLF